MRYRWAVVPGIVVTIGCTTVSAETGTALIHATAEGSSVTGTAALTPVAEGMALQVEVHVAGVPPGKHGLHIHQYGDCGNQGGAAGGHLNPQGVKHGFFPVDGFGNAHPGDMGNIEVGPDGSGSVALALPGVTLSGGSHSVAGRAIILHEKPDDFGQPTGNAGGRIGCGIITVTGK